MGEMSQLSLIGRTHTRPPGRLASSWHPRVTTINRPPGRLAYYVIVFVVGVFVFGGGVGGAVLIARIKSLVTQQALQSLLQQLVQETAL